MGGGQIVYVFSFLLGKRETHKQNSQEISGNGRESPGQSRDNPVKILFMCFLVYWFFLALIIGFFSLHIGLSEYLDGRFPLENPLESCPLRRGALRGSRSEANLPAKAPHKFLMLSWKMQHLEAKASPEGPGIEKIHSRSNA